MYFRSTFNKILSSQSLIFDSQWLHPSVRTSKIVSVSQSEMVRFCFCWILWCLFWIRSHSVASGLCSAQEPLQFCIGTSFFKLIFRTFFYWFVWGWSATYWWPFSKQVFLSGWQSSSLIKIWTVAEPFKPLSYLLLKRNWSKSFILDLRLWKTTFDSHED